MTILRPSVGGDANSRQLWAAIGFEGGAYVRDRPRAQPKTSSCDLATIAHTVNAARVVRPRVGVLYGSVNC
jgi:hypothetical protein